MTDEMVLCWPTPDGVAVTVAAEGHALEDIAVALLPDAVPRVTVLLSSLPDNDFRSAWTFNLERGAVVDLAGAKEAHRNRIRHARFDALAAADRAFMRALEDGDEAATAQAVTVKRTLRALPQRPEIDAALSLDALRGIWWSDLLGPSPYTRGVV